MKTPKPIRPFHWTPEDVSAGMIVCRAHRNARDKWQPNGWTAKWTYKIGFVPGDGRVTLDSNRSHIGAPSYCMIAMTDGMVCSRKMSKADMAALLTKDDMIPMPWSWWLRMTRYLRTQTNPKIAS